MKINFAYNRERDVWCLLKYGNNSVNSSQRTKAFEMLVSEYGDNPTNEDASNFIDKYISQNSIDFSAYIANYQKNWDVVTDEYTKRAESIFKVSLPKDIAVFLTVNGRCPYNILGNYFLVSLSADYMRKNVMHELWHFYTWYKFGVVWEEKLGKQKYNDLKEALTILLNIECGDLFPNIQDTGYPQHKELREKIVRYWQEEKDIDKLWNKLV